MISPTSASPAGRSSQACLLLGSNIAPERNLPLAVDMLSQHMDIAGVSLAWETPAVGSDGPNFLNMALLVRTALSAEQLKEQVLRPVEKSLGRRRTTDKFAPRPIDIDIVAWDCQVTDPDVWQYAHAAVPVAEVLPCHTASEAGETLAQAAQRLEQASRIQPRAEVRMNQEM
jgi:2-amino-4-hydroxy-6-hydroxymethyldihydropteridine diphosphokinase